MILFSDFRYIVFCLSIGFSISSIAIEFGGIMFSLHGVMFAYFMMKGVLVLSSSISVIFVGTGFGL